MKNVFYLFLIVCFARCSSTRSSQTAQSNDVARHYYTIQVYHLASNDQMALVENYLKTAYVPALHRQGIATVGVFKPLANDTAMDKKIVVFTPYTSLQQFEKTTTQLKSDITLEQLSPAYVNAPHNSPAYTRNETILLQAFDKMLTSEVPRLSGAKSSRVYELRSYEGPTEKLYQNKVQMFNEGGEVGLFKRL
ncbi:MAG TPA: hypothetical protein VM187_12750, partial [Niastella sp.]|nr:hypothetical protein [Niastella sp.]